MTVNVASVFGGLLAVAGSPATAFSATTFSPTHPWVNSLAHDLSALWMLGTTMACLGLLLWSGNKGNSIMKGQQS